MTTPPLLDLRVEIGPPATTGGVVERALTLQQNFPGTQQSTTSAHEEEANQDIARHFSSSLERVGASSTDAQDEGKRSH